MRKRNYTVEPYAQDFANAERSAVDFIILGGGGGGGGGAKLDPGLKSTTTPRLSKLRLVVKRT